jgi:hypothetical protein
MSVVSLRRIAGVTGLPSKMPSFDSRSPVEADISMMSTRPDLVMSRMFWRCVDRGVKRVGSSG